MAIFERGYGYDYGFYPSAGGYRGRIGGYRGTTGGYRGAEWGRGYDRGDYRESYRRRTQTDTGDPFGDRQSRTPIRVIRGEQSRGYDHDVRHRYREYGYHRPPSGGSRARGYDAGGGWFW